eukprot:GHVU01218557.1.p1 GENE.GHVU01218557.1~~GHVU01218557.1.p1  ORF type:complete len:103 (+),score=5.45 GHVU01218557.1:175-483(+)
MQQSVVDVIELGVPFSDPVAGKCPSSSVPFPLFGFYSCRLLVHPKGTAGSDSKANWLGLFLEVVKRERYPDHWVLPNVKFELDDIYFCHWQPATGTGTFVRK